MERHSDSINRTSSAAPAEPLAASRASDCQLEPEVEASASGAKAEDVEPAGDRLGMYNHIHDRPYRANSQSAARTWSFTG
jgi:hypothetical protein